MYPCKFPFPAWAHSAVARLDAEVGDIWPEGASKTKMSRNQHLDYEYGYLELDGRIWRLFWELYPFRVVYSNENSGKCFRFHFC